MPIDAAVNLIDDAEEDVYDTITVKAKSEDLVDGLMEDIVGQAHDFKAYYSGR